MSPGISPEDEDEFAAMTEMHSDLTVCDHDLGVVGIPIVNQNCDVLSAVDTHPRIGSDSCGSECEEADGARDCPCTYVH